MRRSIVVAVGILVVAGGLFAAFAWMNNGQLMPRDLLSPAIARPGAATDAPQGAQDQRILADALIVPVQFAALSFPVDGRVAEVLVQEGDRVEQGQVLARLKSDYEVLLVAQAQAEVDRARAQVELLQRGARAEELAAAQAAIDAAQAQADILRQGPREEDVAAAEAAVAAAQAQYATVAASAN
jgi:multidrug efflux pump subunit AcrA (membrane-fusion protein)